MLLAEFVIIIIAIRFPQSNFSLTRTRLPFCLQIHVVCGWLLVFFEKHEPGTPDDDHYQNIQD